MPSFLPFTRRSCCDTQTFQHSSPSDSVDTMFSPEMLTTEPEWKVVVERSVPLAATVSFLMSDVDVIADVIADEIAATSIRLLTVLPRDTM